jgi:hypothetical protein
MWPFAWQARRVSGWGRFQNALEFPELADRPVVWKLNGEPIQLQLFKEADVQAKLRDKYIHVAKSPHSCTAIFQEFDVGNLFKAANTVNRKLKTKHILDSIVKNRVKNILAIHDATMNPMRESTSTLAPTKKKTKKGTANRKTGKKRTKKPKGLTTYHKNLAINGIMRVQQSLQATVRPQIIRNSYVICGTIHLSLCVRHSPCGVLDLDRDLGLGAVSLSLVARLSRTAHHSGL